MRIDEALKHGTEVLFQDSESARLDSEILLCHFLKKNRSYLYAWPEIELTTEIFEQFNQALSLRKTQYPIAYITGYQEFWSLKINVTPDVLIPRADTELLVETALEKLAEVPSPTILELGTGSGAIALALASERSDCQIFASDYSTKALDVAKSNQKQLNLPNINFIHSNWYESIPNQQFDLIISNPPYIDPDDSHMKTGIRFEPLEALCADNHGISDLALIIDKANDYLTRSGWILLEHGHDQGDTITELLRQANLLEVRCLKDLAGNDRTSIGQIV